MPTSDYLEGPVTTADFLGPKSAAQPLTAPTSVDYFLASERNRPFANHQADRLPPRQRWLWVSTVLLMLMLLIFIDTSGTTISNYQLLKQSGTSIRATVIAHNITVTHSKNGTSTTYSITYQFSAPAVNGTLTTYTATENVYYETYRQYPPNPEYLPVLYLASNPAVNMIATDSSNYDGAIWIMKLCIVGELIGFAFLYIFWRRMRNWERLGRDGVLLTGVLQVASGRWISGKGAHYEVKIAYTFADPQTQEPYSKNITLSRNDLRNVPLPTPGTPLYVIFLDKYNYQLL